jgi:ATP-dependent helicase HepA
MTGQSWARGQRWVSESEPELGLGILLGGGNGQLRIEFPAAEETRVYAVESAPLRRVTFLPGDRITRRDGIETTVDAVREEADLRFYRCGDHEIPETELADSMSFSKPEDRLFGGKVDDPQDFDLRGEALARRAEMRRSPIRGLAGARMDLIPHQLFIADEVANRPRPRVLLADEVGLGKTIEACLILHRLLLTGRASRALILVPEPLVHQWFVELLRRFNLSFDVYDETRCEAVETGDPQDNPFLQSQWILAATELLANHENRAAQALAAGWDVLVVDEAHHLEWSPGAAGPAYEVVRKLAETTPALLLLTATPQQLGPEGHFARLQLLDPERYDNLDRYHEETLHYEEIADAVALLAEGGDLDDRVRTRIAGRPRLERALENFNAKLEGARERLIADLLDSFGLGRVMFRNTRQKLGGFPAREPVLVGLPAGDDPNAAKIEWLGRLLGQLDEPEKILVIVRTREFAEEVLEAVRAATGVVGALFHEDLTLLSAIATPRSSPTKTAHGCWFARKSAARAGISSSPDTSCCSISPKTSISSNNGSAASTASASAAPSRSTFPTRSAPPKRCGSAGWTKD